MKKNEIKCPHCGQLFQIDESEYEGIVKQIRNKEFDEAIALKEETLNKEHSLHLQLAIKEAIEEKEKEINDLKTRIITNETNKELEINQAISNKDKEIAELNQVLSSNKEKYIEKENDLKSSYEKQLKMKDEEIERYRDFRAKQSIKLVGESLEQHCLNEFNKLRPLFPNAYFDKDNEISKTSSSKGDFIYRDYDEENNEFVSIMFEMKNEIDTTATKHKNEDFLKELDKDRREKNCEYAVLVSMLEADNDLYNTGIVDMSHKYERMYVIRPQFFIQIITLIRNASLKTVEYKKQLVVAKNQNIDITHFEDNINSFKEAFNKNYELASRKFNNAIEEIDKSIDHLQKIKDALLSSDRNLRLANDKAQDLSIKKLTKNAPSVKEKFDDLKKKS